MTDRRYIVVKQIQAKELERGDVFRHDYHTKGSWQVVLSNAVDCNGRHIHMQFEPWETDVADRELVEIQVEEPPASIWPERWIDSAREVDHHAFCGTCGHHVRDHAETGPRWDCRRLVAILPYEKHGETRPSISGICACRHFTPAGVLA